MKAVPHRLQGVLWSYDIRKMDLRGSRDLIIQQVLNYGDWHDLRWLYRTYEEKDMRRVLRNPRRGMWIGRVLNFWCLMLSINLPKKVRQSATLRMGPV